MIFGAIYQDHFFKFKSFYFSLHPITYVRPMLEYNSPVWSPHIKKDISLIESVQKNFTRKICVRCNISFDSHADHLNKLHLKTLEYCRLANVLILMHKICHNLTNLQFNDYFQYHKTIGNCNLCQHGWILQFLSFKLLQFHKFVVNRCLPICNNLPHIVSASNLFLFKKR